MPRPRALIPRRTLVAATLAAACLSVAPVASAVETSPAPSPTSSATTLGDPSISTEMVTNAAVPTFRVTWSAAGATTYDVSYHKVLVDGSAGREVAWLTNTTATAATFVPDLGDVYVVTVTAKDAAGHASQSASTTTMAVDGPPPADIAPGHGSFSAGWQHVTTKLPYFGGTAALGFRGAAWTVALPAGTTRLDLYATVHALGARGRIFVNGRAWADFETNSSYWGVVSDPYMYPVRTIRGWDAAKPATVTVVAVDAGVTYLALDAYRAL